MVMARDDDAIVVIGAGVVGAAVAYHLAALGHERVSVYDARERATLPGSTGLAPGFVGRLSATEELAVLAVDSVGTYLEVAAMAPELPSGRPAASRWRPRRPAWNRRTGTWSTAGPWASRQGCWTPGRPSLSRPT